MGRTADRRACLRRRDPRVSRSRSRPQVSPRTTPSTPSRTRPLARPRLRMERLFTLPSQDDAPCRTAADTPRPWWRDAVVYQVYIRSFLDSTGDGVGDLAGVRAGLPYLSKLGVDGIWLSPFYPSPQHDHGYDVADYQDVDPIFGDLAEFDALVDDAHRLGIKIVVDIVPNHCSSAHPWFQAALADGPGSAARELFHFADGRGRGGDEPPNNWRAMFGGPAWTRVAEADGRPGQWYLQMFTPEQPDFNWRDPRVPRVLRAGAAVLAGPRRGRLPDRRGGRPVQGHPAARLPRPGRRRAHPRLGQPAGLEPARGAHRLAPVAGDLRGVPGARRPRPADGRRGVGAHRLRAGPVRPRGRAAPGVLLPPARRAVERQGASARPSARRCATSRAPARPSPGCSTTTTRCAR